MDAAAVPSPGDAPDEAVQILSQVARHRHVRGCVTLTSDCRVIWSGGSAFTASDKLASVVGFVRDTLEVVRRHVDLLEPDDELGLVRVRTKRWEVMITPSTFVVARYSSHR